jgi:hypothetical protein
LDLRVKENRDIAVARNYFSERCGKYIQDSIELVEELSKEPAESN